MRSSLSYDTQKLAEPDTIVLSEINGHFNLIVWNDDINTFDWVIETLIDICGHSQQQAEQCAMLIHTKGRYAVKTGDYDVLKPQCDAITERKIGATIEVMA
jgi:ATP-dependent Clp protease adaptor protein ClpS